MGMDSDFSNPVYEIVKKVPCGRVTTYGDVAKALGGLKYSRAVGNALNRNPYAPIVPCHRVVKSDGSLGGFAEGCSRKKEMLIREDVKFNGEELKEFEEIRWRF